MHDVRSLLYDADGREVVDAELAVRGVVLEIADDGTTFELDTWEVDEHALDGDEGELATRRRHRWLAPLGL